MVLQDGSTAKADLVVGADGSISRVRQDVSPEYKPTTLNMACFQVSMPPFQVTKDSVLRQIPNGPDTVITLSPSRDIDASPAPIQNLSALQSMD